MTTHRKIGNNRMEFVEEPLRYNDALEVVRDFEREYKLLSVQFFMALDSGDESVRADPDDIYEWRSHYEFVKAVDDKLRRVLEANTDLSEGDVVYSPRGASSTGKNVRSRRNQDLALAA